MEMFDSCTLIN